MLMISALGLRGRALGEGKGPPGPECFFGVGRPVPLTLQWEFASRGQRGYLAALFAARDAPGGERTFRTIIQVEFGGVLHLGLPS